MAWCLVKHGDNSLPYEKNLFLTKPLFIHEPKCTQSRFRGNRTSKRNSVIFSLYRDKWPHGRNVYPQLFVWPRASEQCSSGL